MNKLSWTSRIHCSYWTYAQIIFPACFAGQADLHKDTTKQSIIRMNVAAPEEVKNLKPAQFDWQYIQPIDLHY